MSCNCTSPLSPNGEPLPQVADILGLSTPQTPCCGDAVCEPSSSSEGSDLPSSWLDSGCATKGVTILARVGNKLARFSGSGFLALVNGKFNVVQAIPLKITTVWHRWWKPTPASPPILGEPLPYPYLVVADAGGTMHGIKGTHNEDAVTHWNSTTKEFTNKPISEVRICQKGLLPRAGALELTGYAAIPADNSPDLVRCQATLEGTGILWSDAVPTVDADCECSTPLSLASVVSALPFPDDNADTLFTLKYSRVSGLHWVENV